MGKAGDAERACNLVPKPTPGPVNKKSRRRLYLIELAAAAIFFAFVWPRIVRLVHSFAPSVYPAESQKR
jgi:hypothetical protein